MERLLTNRPFGFGRGLAALASLLGALFLLLWWLGWQIHAYPTPLTDLGSYFLPKYQYAADRLASGSFPLWNPYEFGGIPFLATLQPAVFYPPIRIAYTLFSGEAAYVACFFFHIALGAIASLLLLRDLKVRLWPAVFASVWVVQPTWIMRVWDHPVYIWATAWIPLLILLLRSLLRQPNARTAGLLALVAAMQILSGYPPLILATLYLLALGLPFFFLEGRERAGQSTAGRAIALLFAATAVTALITAAQILPTAELMTLSERSQEAANFAQTAENIAEKIPKLAFFVGIPPPTFLTAVTDFWLVYGPIPIVLILCALALGWRSAFLWYALAATILAALLPLESYRHLPFYGLVRFALEWAFIAPMLVYLLAALGLDAILRRGSLPAVRVAALVAMLLGLTTLWNWQMIDRGWREANVDLDLEIPSWVEEECNLADANYRAFWPLGQLRGSLMANRIRSIGGYEQSLIPARSAHLNEKLAIGNGAFNVATTDALARNHLAVSRMGLRCVIVGQSATLIEAGYEELASESPPFAYRNPAARPRARLAFSPTFASSPEDALAKTFTDRDADIVLEGSPESLAPCPQAEQASVRIVRDDPERVEVEVESPCAGYLLLADTQVPNWTATLDGRPTEIRPANYAMRAVPISAGRHSVVFRYDTWTLPAGLTLSGIGLLIALFMITRRPDRSRPREP